MRGREGGEKTLLRAAFRGRERGGKKMAAREKEGRVVKTKWTIAKVKGGETNPPYAPALLERASV